MRVKIGPIKDKKGKRLDIVKELPPPEPDPDLPIESFVTPLVVTVSVINTGESFLVTGRAEIEANLLCSRCLAPFRGVVRHDFEEEFFPVAKKGKEVDDADPFGEERMYYEGEELNLTPLVEEAIALAVPMKTLCSEDCPGLCPVCGTARVDGQCRCQEEQVDPRLAALADFFKE